MLTSSRGGGGAAPTNGTHGSVTQWEREREWLAGGPHRQRLQRGGWCLPGSAWLQAGWPWRGGGKRPPTAATGDAAARRRRRLGARRERKGKNGGGVPHRGSDGAGGGDDERRRRATGGRRRTAAELRDTLREEKREVRGREGVHGKRKPRRRIVTDDLRRRIVTDEGWTRRTSAARTRRQWRRGAAAALAAARGGRSSGDGGCGWAHGAGAVESSGAADGKRKNEEENAGMVYMGSGGTDEAGRRPDFSPTWGSGERELGGFKIRIRPLWARGAGGKARAASRQCGEGRGARSGCGRSGESGGGAAVSAVIATVGWRWKKGPTGGPHLSVTRREEGGSGPAQQGGRAREEVGLRPNKRKKRKEKGRKRREKEKGDFPGI
uniref:Plant disease resistance polyprotein-like n=1 Tax=Oryza sativa subsp. japonica TaxID=39947 RepID=Q67W60_ORYSJ|nr:plant disease resistance polyprotein-like [Oryza sativa Japonica Group]